MSWESLPTEMGNYSPIISFDWGWKIPNQLPIIKSLLIFPNNLACGVSELKRPFPKTPTLYFVPGISYTSEESQQWFSCSFISRLLLPGWEVPGAGTLLVPFYASYTIKKNQDTAGARGSNCSIILRYSSKMDQVPLAILRPFWEASPKSFKGDSIADDTQHENFSIQRLLWWSED